ncbi:hypothetical protein OG394_33110 [Kribbella sp. NBC_01245]|uniref:hypothetical protein n=1 Tax=Kribbella sp. NBC_01245 TaxID=2903578 RepID=UPI002E2B8E34|nr:hypothetical protein [Kribbella sp. NBC_01245]
MSGYKWLFWWNWLVAVIAVVIAGFGIDRIQLTDDELYDATQRAVRPLDGTSDLVTATRIEAAVEDLVDADLYVERISSDSAEADKPRLYEITRQMQSSDDDQAPAASCVEVSEIERKHDSGTYYSYISLFQGACSR